MHPGASISLSRNDPPPSPKLICWAEGPAGCLPIGQKSCTLEPVLCLTPSTIRAMVWNPPQRLGRRGPSGLCPERTNVLQARTSLTLHPPNTEIGGVVGDARFARRSPGGAPEVLRRPSFRFTCKLVSTYTVPPSRCSMLLSHRRILIVESEARVRVAQ